MSMQALIEYTVHFLALRPCGGLREGCRGQIDRHPHPVRGTGNRGTGNRGGASCNPSQGWRAGHNNHLVASVNHTLQKELQSDDQTCIDQHQAHRSAM